MMKLIKQITLGLIISLTLTLNAAAQPPGDFQSRPPERPAEKDKEKPKDKDQPKDKDKDKPRKP